MFLGYGKKLTQETKRQAWVKTLPPQALGKWLHKIVWERKKLETENAPNQWAALVGQSGARKTTFTMGTYIGPRIESGEGSFLQVDAAGDLTRYSIAKCVEQGWPPEKFMLLDWFSKYGYFTQDFLEDDPNDEFSIHQVAEEFVTATMFLSAIRSEAGARQLNLTRRAAIPLIATQRTLADLPRFIEDEGFRAQVCMESKMHDIIQFWVGNDSYFKREIPKGSLESLYNKFSPLLLHPALKRTVSHKTSSFSLWEFMNSGGIVLVDLNEHRLKLEIRKTIAELLQYYFRLQVLKRHRLPPQDRKLLRL